ncbi:MAG TPA: sensor histidine kinase [Terriglobales bacterium]|nr:sensor histidine kinase [Terriglobales bacterium]
MRLLPKEVKAEAGWMPYIWLVWLSYFVCDPVFHRRTTARWVEMLVGISIFLALYFLGFWLKGKRKLWAIASITVLAMALTPYNWGASAFFVYAAAFAGFCGSTEFAIAILLVLEACASLIIWPFHLALGLWVSTSFLIAAIGGMNIQQAKRIAANARLRMAQEEIEHLAKTAERERIARDLHDVLGHTLSVIILKSELASKLADKDTPRAIQEIRDVERISREALAEVRSALKGYRAAGLNAEIAQARATLETAGIKVQVYSSQLDLNAAQEGVLALVMREAVTNILRHSKATECSLRLAQANGCCTLEIADNGCGSSGVEGEGLKGMRQRVEILGGSMQRNTSPGTTLIVTVPRTAIQPNGTKMIRPDQTQ